MSHLIRNSLVLVLIGLLASCAFSANKVVQASNPLDAEESDPKKLGWMTGFPPPPDKLIMQPESDFLGQEQFSGMKAM